MTEDSYKYYIINISYAIAEKANKLIKLQENDECNNCKSLLEFNIVSSIFKQILKYSITTYDSTGAIVVQGNPNCYTEEEFQSLLNFLNILLSTNYCTDISNITI
jgi:hypothetical protein